MEGGAEPSSEERPVWIITLKGEEEPIYGYVDEDDWDKTLIPVELDRPWAPEIRHVNPRDIEQQEREWSGARAERLAE